MEERLRTHHESLSRAVLFTRAADSKAAPILAVQIALVGALATRFDKLLSIMTDCPFDTAALALIVLVIAYVAFLSASVAIATMVFLPITRPSGQTSNSLLYFEDVQAMSLEEFTSKTAQLDEDDIERQLLQQIHAVSRVVSVKMRRVRWAFILSVPAVVLWVALMAWGSL